MGNSVKHCWSCVSECTVLALRVGFPTMTMTPRAWLRRRPMACEMPVGTGLKMGWGCYNGDRGISARYTIRVINCWHTEGNTSNSAATKSNANNGRYETQSLWQTWVRARLCLISDFLDFCPRPNDSRHFWIMEYDCSGINEWFHRILLPRPQFRSSDCLVCWADCWLTDVLCHRHVSYSPPPPPTSRTISRDRSLPKAFVPQISCESKQRRSSESRVCL